MQFKAEKVSLAQHEDELEAAFDEAVNDDFGGEDAAEEYEEGEDMGEDMEEELPEIDSALDSDAGGGGCQPAASGPGNGWDDDDDAEAEPIAQQAKKQKARKTRIVAISKKKDIPVMRCAVCRATSEDTTAQREGMRVC